MHLKFEYYSKTPYFRFRSTCEYFFLLGQFIGYICMKINVNKDVKSELQSTTLYMAN